MEVLVLAPRGRDAEVLRSSLGQAGISCVTCQDVASLCTNIRSGAGTLLIAEEALSPVARHMLMECLGTQPPWSSLPLVILTLPNAGNKSLEEFLSVVGPLGSAIVVERPIKPQTLQSVLRMALLARERQYELGEHLAEIERQRVQIANHRDNLQSLVENRTAELKRTLRKIQDAERLAALGNIAAGIGHDIANMTMPIRVRLETLASGAGTAEIREDLEAIGKSLDHLTNLSAGLRLMALDPTRDGVSAPALDLHKWSREAESVLRNVLPRGVSFICELPTEVQIPGVAISSHRLTQVLFNLVQNAGEAIAATPTHKGTVRLAVQVRSSETPAGPNAQVVEISVMDDGPGIAPEHLERLFEPYFTTKRRAISTGMGLGMVRGIVESAGGSIRVESKTGQGAMFSITLPALPAPSGVAETTPPSEPERFAFVALSDPRQNALATTILRALNVHVVRDGSRSGEESEVPETDVWVTSAASSTAVGSYLSAGMGRRVVLMDDADSAGKGRETERADQRLWRITSKPGPGGLRDTLIAVMRSFSKEESSVQA